MGILHDASAVVLDMECPSTPRSKESIFLATMTGFALAHCPLEALKHTGMLQCNISLQRVVGREST